MSEEEKQSIKEVQPETPREKGDDPRDEDSEGPTYDPGSPGPDDPGIDDFFDKGESEPSPEDESEDEPEDPSAEIIQLEDLDNKTISQHRKAFVNWVNNIFYERIKDLNDDSPLKIYQILVQQYLSVETPYRGLLVYHGLGTGKTATAISLAEGLRGQMRINTLLPASLEIINLLIA